ncbi:MAG: hypothetical protein J0G95_10825 [Rhizobiales bacterium]|nr:hypothetical protein [Hyphomicrobiales bacterium]
MKKVVVPGYDVPIVLQGGLVNPDWYSVFKFIEGLQPLSDIPPEPPFTVDPVTPGSTSVSTQTLSKTAVGSPTGSVQSTFQYYPGTSSDIANNYATIYDVFNKQDSNTSSQNSSIAALNVRITALENKINEIITALS